jgi:hypothetical protein
MLVTSEPEFDIYCKENYHLEDDKRIGPAALTLMDRQTFGSSAHGQTNSQCVVIFAKVG